MVEMNMGLTLLIRFTPDQFAEFQRPISGAGGGQQFVRRCQIMLDTQHRDTGQRTLALYGEDIEKWFRYRDDYGSGGFQSRMGRQTQQSLL